MEPRYSDRKSDLENYLNGYLNDPRFHYHFDRKCYWFLLRLVCPSRLHALETKWINKMNNVINMADERRRRETFAISNGVFWSLALALNFAILALIAYAARLWL
jgi:hypothetical protein